MTWSDLLSILGLLGGILLLTGLLIKLGGFK